MRRCLKNMGKASVSGRPRGFCKREKGHSGGHGNGSCPQCANKSKIGFGMCHQCRLNSQRRIRGNKPLNLQIPGKWHIFPCGCSGYLPKAAKNNKFAIRYVKRKNGWSCRILGMFKSSRRNAKIYKHKAINPTPHAVIRKMMEKKTCWRCRRPLTWILGYGKTPHLHHCHKTGEPLGFTHAICNPSMMQIEIDRLREKLRNLCKK